MDTLTLNAAIVPDIKQEDSKALKVWIVASHSDKEINNRIYPGYVMQRDVKTWLEPYRKPVLVHHDDHKDAIGRVTEAYYFKAEDKEAAERLIGRSIKMPKDASGFILLQTKITDRNAISKVLDEVYLSASIGFAPKVAVCSICNTNLVVERCKHVPGKEYDGEKALVIVEDMEFSEISFVNNPADPYAGVVLSQPIDDSESVSDETEQPAEQDSREENKKTDQEENDMEMKELQEKYEDLLKKFNTLNDFTKGLLVDRIIGMKKEIGVSGYDDEETVQKKREDYMKIEIPGLVVIYDELKETVSAFVDDCEECDETDEKTEETTEEPEAEKPKTDEAEAEKTEEKQPEEDEQEDKTEEPTETDETNEEEQKEDDKTEQDGSETEKETDAKETDSGIRQEEPTTVISNDATSKTITLQELAMQKMGIKRD